MIIFCNKYQIGKLLNTLEIDILPQPNLVDILEQPNKKMCD